MMSTKQPAKYQPHEGHRDRLRKRFLRDYGESMESHELLELLLFYAIPRSNTNQIAHALLHRFGSLSAVMNASAGELAEVGGIGEKAAVYLKAVSAATRRIAIENLPPVPLCADSETILEYIKSLFLQVPHERMYMLCYDDRMRMIACEPISDGSVSGVQVNVEKMMRLAISSGADSVVLAHNHPRSVAHPSQDDLQTTENCEHLLNQAGVALLEHFIVAGNDVCGIIQHFKNRSYP